MTQQTFQINERIIEALMGMPSKTIGALLCVSGDRKRCPECDRETNWLDLRAMEAANPVN